ARSGRGSARRGRGGGRRVRAGLGGGGPAGGLVRPGLRGATSRGDSALRTGWLGAQNGRTSAEGARRMPSVNGIIETALYVEDLGRSVRFYQGLFGFRTLLEDERLCALSVGDRQVLLLFVRGGSVRPSEAP